MVMESMFQMVLGLPGVRVVEVARTKRGEWVLRVESTISTTACARCGRTIAEPRGRGDRVRLRHLPVFEQPVFIELRPKRFGCTSCAGAPVTTQALEWYDGRSPNTRPFDLAALPRQAEAAEG
jgi:transposase